MKSKSLFESLDVDHIGEKSALFETKFKEEIDKNKKTFLIITKNSGEKYNHLFGFIRNIIELLKEHYNIIYVASDKDTLNLPNYYKFNLGHYNKINQTKFKRKNELAENASFNKNILYQEFEKSFNFDIDKVLFIEDSWHMLPMTSYVSKKDSSILHDRLNEFHDYVGSDKERIKDITKHIKKVNENFDNKISILAFSMFRKNMMLNLVKYFNEKKKIEMLYTFSIDPATWLHFFDFNKINNTKFYFENDKRGTRDFTKFPIAHLEHLIYEPKKLKIKTNTEKTKDFFFIGTVLKQKGDRIKVWETFLKNLRAENSSMFIPDIAEIIYWDEKSKNSAHVKKRAETAKLLFSKTLKEMEDNPLWNGHLIPKEVPTEIQKYKYGFIARCVSFEDSLNYRPILYANYDVLPLFDFKYDPSYLQIPEEIQKKLVCYDHIDIEKRINYYNEHDDERIELLKQLSQHLKINEFKENWKTITKSYFI